MTTVSFYFTIGHLVCFFCLSTAYHTHLLRVML
nr:MAG TPA: hypothetical protein [Bacteriophage sp.]